MLLAWLVATLLHIQWGITTVIRDVSPVEVVLQAGLLFGYFTVLMAVGRLIALLLLLVVSLIALRMTAKSLSRSSAPGPDPVTVLTQDKAWQAFQHGLGRVLTNLADVAAMFAAFLLCSESILELLAPIGLAIAIALFILGKFDDNNSPSESPSEKRAD